jgi:hypothetical protein
MRFDGLMEIRKGRQPTAEYLPRLAFQSICIAQPQLNSGVSGLVHPSSSQDVQSLERVRARVALAWPTFVSCDG